MRSRERSAGKHGNLLFGILYTTQRRDAFCSWHWAARAPLCGQSLWETRPGTGAQQRGHLLITYQLTKILLMPMRQRLSQTSVPGRAGAEEGHSSGWIPLTLSGTMKYNISDHRNTGENSRCFLQQPKQPATFNNPLTSICSQWCP